MAQRNYYDILGVPRHADLDTIRQAYRKLAQDFHPDSTSATRPSAQRFQLITEAYNTLRDPDSRAKYDRELRSRPTSSYSTPKSQAQSSATPRYRRQSKPPPHTRASARPQSPPPQTAPLRKDLNVFWDEVQILARLRPKYVTVWVISMGVVLVLFGLTFTMSSNDNPLVDHTSGTIESVEIELCGFEGECYVIEYNYVVDHVIYRETIALNQTSYKVGDGINVQYYLSDPAESEITDAPFPLGAVRFGLVFGAVGLVLIFVYLLYVPHLDQIETLYQAENPRGRR